MARAKIYYALFPYVSELLRKQYAQEHVSPGHVPGLARAVAVAP